MQALATKKNLYAKHRLSKDHNTNALYPRTPKYLVWHKHITWGREVKCYAYKTLYIDVQQNNNNQYLQQSFEMLRWTQFANNKDGPSPSHTHKFSKHYVIGRLWKKLETT
jgi:hypothetical protein